MKKLVLALFLMSFLGFSSCGVENNVDEEFNVSPEMLYSNEEQGIFLINIFSNNDDGFDFLLKIRETEIWKNLGFDYRYAVFVDEIEKHLGINSFENVFMRILKSGVVFAIQFEDFLDFDKPFLISANVFEKDALNLFFDKFLKNKYGDLLRKFYRDDFSFWFVQDKSLYLARIGHNFLISNDLKKFDLIVANIKNREFRELDLLEIEEAAFSDTVALRGFRGEDLKDTSSFPFLSILDLNIYGTNVFSIDFFKEKNGVRMFSKIKNEISTDSGLILSEYFSGEETVLFLETDVLKRFFSEWIKMALTDEFGEEEILAILDSRGALLLDFESKIPGVVFYLKFLEKDFVAGQKVLKYFDDFFVDFVSSFKDEVSSLGENIHEDFLKVEKLGNGLRKLVFDLSVLDDERIFVVSNIIEGLNAESKIELYYGFSENGIFTIALKNDFMEIFNRAGVLNAEKFVSTRSKLSMKNENTVFFIDFSEFWRVWEKFFSSRNEFVLEQEKKSVFEEIILNNLKRFILTGKENGQFFELEGFLEFEI